MSNDRSKSREKALAEMSSKPLMRDAVYHSAQYKDTKSQKEVCDILLLHRKDAIIISIKNQDVKREQDDTQRWLNKNAEKAIKQLHGACKTIRSRKFWCEHRSGRIDFTPGDMTPCHNIALLETDYEATLDNISFEHRPDSNSVPLTIMSVNDFVYLLAYLRTFFDLRSYLQQRSSALSDHDRRSLAREHYFFSYYTVHKDSFAGFKSLDDAKQVVARGQHVIPGSAFRDRERIFASILEEFMSEAQTATADASPALYPPGRRKPIEDEQRQMLAELRLELSDLSIQERAVIGDQIGYLCQKAREGGDGSFFAPVRSARFPDKVFVCVVCRGRTEDEAWIDGMDILLAACAHYSKRTGLLLMLIEVGTKTIKKYGRIDNFQPTNEYLDAGREYFSGRNPQRLELLR